MQHHLTGQRSSRGDRHPCHTQWTFSLEVVCTFALQGVAGGSGDGVSHAGFVREDGCNLKTTASIFKTDLRCQSYNPNMHGAWGSGKISDRN